MSVYDDVAVLQQEMTAAQAAIAAMQLQTLAEGADLFALGVGDYLIPNATICATLLNKPTTSNATGTVKVISTGDSGQKAIYYIPCSKLIKRYFTAAYYESAWGDWQEVVFTDSGWLNLPLADGVTAYSDEQKPRYRQIGKEIFLTGICKGLTARDSYIGTLPAGYRPDKRVIVPVASVGQMISKITINTNGTITYNRSTIEPLVAENWHSIACSFSI